MANPWCRLWSDMPNDPKWRTIAKISGRQISEVIAVYVHMMVCASNANERGRTQGWCDEDVASALDLETAHVEAIRQAMQGRVLDDDCLTGWKKRQPVREDGAADRSKQWREKKKQQANANERKETNANAGKRPEEEADTEEDTDTDTKKKLSAAFEKKRAWLAGQFPGVDLDYQKVKLLDKYGNKPVLDAAVLINNWFEMLPKEKPKQKAAPSGRPDYLHGVR